MVCGVGLLKIGHSDTLVDDGGEMTVLVGVLRGGVEMVCEVETEILGEMEEVMNGEVGDVGMGGRVLSAGREGCSVAWGRWGGVDGALVSEEAENEICGATGEPHPVDAVVDDAGAGHVDGGVVGVVGVDEGIADGGVVAGGIGIGQGDGDLIVEIRVEARVQRLAGGVDVANDVLQLGWVAK